MFYKSFIKYKTTTLLESNYIKNIITILILVCFFETNRLSFAQNLPKGYVKVADFAKSQDIAFQWFPIQKMIVLTKDLKVVRLVVNSNKAIVNNKEVVLPSPPILLEGQVYAPAKVLLDAFSVALESNSKQANEITPPPPNPTIQASQAQPKIITEESEKQLPMLTSVRHSTREDHTRVVFEFNSKVSYSTEFTSPSKFKLVLKNCQNLVPIKRSNPVGRDIKNISFTSPPTKDGLIVTFDLPPDAKKPTIETVANPYRIIVSFFSNIATSTPAISSAAVQLTSSTKQKEGVVSNKTNAEPYEFAIDVPLLQLLNQSAKGKIILIEAGHGGADIGASIDNTIAEKDITLTIARNLNNILRNIGFNPILVRNSDTYIPPETRISIINKTGADFLISIHVGSSIDKEQEGISCIWFSPNGFEIADKAILDNWLKTTRFDIAKELAQKINYKLVQNLNVKNRGCLGLPINELMFIIHPAIIIEVGMLSNDKESSKLASQKYLESVSKAIANGIIDFYNSYNIN